MADDIWIAVCEVLVEPGDLPSGLTKAFVRIATWADSLDAVKGKVSKYLASHDWTLLSIEDASPIDETRTYGDEAMDMIARARSNTNAILLGRFHSYKEN